MWHLETKTFENLTVTELYELLKLRQEVFIIEQNCLFNDIDGLDPQALHCLLKDENHTIKAYTRLFNSEIVYPGYNSIGRVLCAPEDRMHGLGRKIFAYSIEEIRKQYGSKTIKIGAQAYLEKFYSSFGFVQKGEQYLEDGIWHIHMYLVIG
jgi:ElaA protein